MDQLADEFDVVVIGTGLSETIFAAAASRAGKSVLQVDRNNYYGDEWASFSLSAFEDWVTRQTGAESGQRISSYSNIQIIAPHTECADEAISDLRKRGNRFTIDLCPRLIFAKGAMVELLVQSNICRYLEFKNCTRLLTRRPASDRWLHVPCTRDSVFTSTHLSLIQKRKFMKFIDLCAQLSRTESKIEELKTHSFEYFLQISGLDADLVHVIASVTGDAGNASEGLKSLETFVQSSGRFGPTPFLWPLFGSGELPQAFARLSAVFGGVYCLDQESSIESSPESCLTVGVNGCRIRCHHVVGNVTSLPVRLLSLSEELISSHAVLITKKSFDGCDENEITSARFSVNECEVSVIEIGSGSQSCPPGFFILYMSCLSRAATAKDDLLPVCEQLFPVASDSGQDRIVLWSCYFNRKSHRKVSCTKGNVFAFQSPSVGVDYESQVSQAKSLFSRLFPGEPFLPRAPDAEDIVIDDEEQAHQA